MYIVNVTTGFGLDECICVCQRSVFPSRDDDANPVQEVLTTRDGERGGHLLRPPERYAYPPCHILYDVSLYYSIHTYIICTGMHMYI